MSSQKVERWGPGLQEPSLRKGTTAKRPSPKPATAGSSDFNKLALTTVPLRQPHTVTNAAPYCRLSPLSAEGAGPIETLAKRYLAGALQHPVVKRLAALRHADISFDICGTDRIDSTATASMADWSRRGLVVKKLSPHVDLGELTEFGGYISPPGNQSTAISSWLTAKLPHVHGFYFSNVYPTSSTSDDDAVVALLEKALVSEGQEHDQEGSLLVCSVAVGRMCMNDKSVLDTILDEAGSISASGGTPMTICAGLRETLERLQTTNQQRPSSSHSAVRADRSSGAATAGDGCASSGFDSLVCSVDNTPNTLLFDSSRIVPTHIIRFRCNVARLPPPPAIQRAHPATEIDEHSHLDAHTRRPGTAMSSSPAQWGTRPSSQINRPATALSPSRGLSRLGRATAADSDQGGSNSLASLRDDIRRASHAASAHVRQQCKDMIDALCARRESILAGIRAQEDALLHSANELEVAANVEGLSSGEAARRGAPIASAAAHLRDQKLSAIAAMREINRLNIQQMQGGLAMMGQTSPITTTEDECRPTLQPFDAPPCRPQTSPSPYHVNNGNTAAHRRVAQVTAALNGRLRKPPLSEGVIRNPADSTQKGFSHV